jgi:hypothetical protein
MRREFFKGGIKNLDCMKSAENSRKPEKVEGRITTATATAL